MKKNKVLSLLLISGLILSNSSPLLVLAEEATQHSSVLLSESTDAQENQAKTEEQSDETPTEAAPSVDESKTTTSTAETTVNTSETTSSQKSEISASSEASSETNTDQSEQTQSTSSSETASSSEEKKSTEASSESSKSTETSKEVTKTETKTATSSATSVAKAATASSSSTTATSSQQPTISAAVAGFDENVVNNAVTATPFYVEHWSGKDAYTHNILAHRYGISAEQLDGFLQSTGIAYDSNRINGKKLLEWERKSGLDVRAIVAIAISESSLGTAGVARLAGANMFGYGAFDNNPENAQNYSDEAAVMALTKTTIIDNKNVTFKVQDDKAKKLAAGQLNTVAEGGVYFTDASGSGERRAKIMENLDRWIDEHGGTPAIPDELKNLSTAMLANVPTGFQVSASMNASAYTASTYPWGQCTWYVYNRAKELGYSFGEYMGNGGDWQHQVGYETTHEAKVGYAVSFAPGQAGADATYGHVAIVEEVKEDGSVLISESNAMGLGVVSYRTFSASQASQLTYVIGHK